MQVDCDLKSKFKNRKRENLKGDSVKMASVEFKNRLNTVHHGGGGGQVWEMSY